MPSKATQASLTEAGGPYSESQLQCTERPCEYGPYGESRLDCTEIPLEFGPYSETLRGSTDIPLESLGPSTDIERDAANYDGKDPDKLDWDGPDDPENPQNWPAYKRRMQVILVALITLVNNLAMTMFAPGSAELMAEFHSTSETIGSLTVSIYVLGFVVGSSVLAPLSEMYGRFPIYSTSVFMYAAFTIGCAFSTNIGSFIAFRLLAGCAGSCTLVLCGGTLADVIAKENQGRWMSLFVLGPLAGPVVGPIAGGFVVQSIGWRWIFRIILIAYGVIIVLCIIFLRETYAPVILRRRAARRGLDVKSSQSGNSMSKFANDLLRPARLLIFSPIVLFLSLYAAFAFGLQFILFTTFTDVFMNQYHWSVGISGLAYIGLGIGMFGAVIAHTIFAEKIVRTRAAKNGVSKPEDRLPLMAYMAPALPIGMFWYGWSVDKNVHWIVPELATAVVGIGIVFIMMPQMVYLVQVFGAEAGASALAANTFLRYIAGAFLPLAGPPMYEKLGLGWGNSLLGFLGLAFVPLPWILTIYGERFRLSGQRKA
ncbi:hypothetical protein G7054_g3105 [Neopestalotiopsis clavispora]|nr:hypothetical protein G7054_g3105 [Neopestalotiopsis clavispora]